MPNKTTTATLLLAGLTIGMGGLSRAQTTDLENALALFRQRRWEEAASAFAGVEKAEPGKTEALLLQGKSLVNLNRLEEAAQALESYLEKHAGSSDARYLLAYVRFRQDRPKESLELMQAASKLMPPTADDLKVGALDYVLLADYTDAGQYLEQALRLAPENVEARYHLGRVRYQQNRFDDAIAAFREVLRLDPNSVKAENNLGLSLEARNQMDEARAAYERAIALDEKSAVHSEQPYLNLGSLLVKVNHASEAIPLLSKAAGISPKSAPVQYQLSKAYFDLHEFAKAQAAAEQAVRLAPDDAPAHYLLGRIYQRSGQTDRASQEFQLTEKLRVRQDAGGMGMASGSDRR